MSDQVERLDLLEPYWEKFKALPWYERSHAINSRNWRSQGWQHYGLYDGWSVSIALWYSEATGCSFPPSASPKQIVHEWRKCIKSRQEVACEA